MAKRRRRSKVLPYTSLAAPVLALAGWSDMHEPFKGEGLLALLVLGAIAGLMTPAILVSLGDAPKLLVPARWRASYRYKRKHEDHWYLSQQTREEQKSGKVPLYLWRTVLYIDRYQCVWCHATEDLDVDHIWPWMAGGLSVLWNLMTLCSKCNTLKLDYCPAKWYRPRCSPKNRAEAREILRCERWHRWNPARWVRAGFALVA